MEAELPNRGSLVAVGALAALLVVVPACGRSAEKSGGDAAAGSATAANLRPSDSIALQAKPVPVAPKADQLVIVAGGDINLGRGLGQRILRDPSCDPLRALGSLWSEADLRFANLESQLSDQKGLTVKPDNWLVFTGPPAGAEVLARARVDLVSTANNHMWDFGYRGLVETLGHLDRVEIAHAGASVEPDEMYRPALLKVKGWSVALFAVTEIWNQGSIRKHRGRFHVAWADVERLSEPIEKARRENDVVLLSYHGGGEYMDETVRWTRDFVRKAMALGVDAVLGHHPHVPQGVAWHEGRPVFYSLGNLVFAPNEHRWTTAGMLARLTFGRERPLEVQACPFRFVGYEPSALDRPQDRAFTSMFRAHLKSISLGVGGTELGEPGALGCMTLTPKAVSPPRALARPRSETPIATRSGKELR